MLLIPMGASAAIFFGWNKLLSRSGGSDDGFSIGSNRGGGDIGSAFTRIAVIVIGIVVIFIVNLLLMFLSAATEGLLVDLAVGQVLDHARFVVDVRASNS